MKSIFFFLLPMILGFGALAQNRGYKTHMISSEALKESRPISVSLPEHYDSGTESFGVLYVLDGEYAFDYAVGATSFLSNAFNHLPPLIVVGVPNIDRTRDMAVNHNPGAAYLNFLDFVENELMPFIGKTYRTNGFDLLYGWSSASNISMQFLARNPKLFKAHIQTGTGIGEKTTAFFSEHLPKNTYDNNFLYVNVEGEGPRLKGFSAYKKLISDLSLSGLVTKFEAIGSSSHVNVMADGIYRGLQFIFSDFYIPESIAVRGATQTIDYYRQLSGKYGFDVRIPVGAINETAGILFHNEKPEEAIKLLQYGIAQYPSSYELAGSLGEVYEYLGERNKAADHYHLALKKSNPDSAPALKYQHLHQKMSK